MEKTAPLTDLPVLSVEAMSVDISVPSGQLHAVRAVNGH